MKIAILSRNKNLYSTRRLIEACESRGHEVQVLDVLRCYMNITSMRPSIHYKGELLENFDAVIPRIGASVTFYGTAVLRQFEMMGVFVANESQSITRSRRTPTRSSTSSASRRRQRGAAIRKQSTHRHRST